LIAFSISTGVAPGSTFSCATIPVTGGVAIDVPLITL
jgi:hypothetical protein